MSIRHLHDDMLLYLSKDLTAKDSLSLAISGVNERFSFLYGTNRNTLVLTECYFLSNKSWKGFFKHYITPSSITVFDVSHCYWLKAKVLIRCMTKMPNLEELHIQDTRMSLRKMPILFKACQKIKKLSMTLREENLDEFKKGVMEKSSLKWMKRGFRKITHLKLLTFVPLNSGVWIVALGVLKWCRDLLDLLIDLTFVAPSDCSSTREDGEDFDALKTELLPHFNWMKGLKSLAILAKDDGHDRNFKFTREFVLDWLSELEFQSLERLWVFPLVFNDELEHALICEMTSPVVKSGMMNLCTDDHISELNAEQFHQLEHLADIKFDEVKHDGLEHLPHLKYISGKCGMGAKGLNDFCKRHPELEELHFSLYNFNMFGLDLQHNFGLRDWQLLKLKVLVYQCSILSQGVMDHLNEACPNIEQLHIKRLDGSSFGKDEITVNFFTSIRFNCLKWLNIEVPNLFDGSYLLSMVNNCPRLERLNLDGEVEGKAFFLYLIECLPSARNLRDLSILVDWSCVKKDRLIDLSIFFKTLIRCCPNLEKLSLHVPKDGWEHNSAIDCSQLQESILSFVKGMSHLVYLSLSNFPFDVTVIEKRLMEEILQSRPAFWVGLSPSITSDLSVLHYDGINFVYPGDPYYFPPRF